MAESGSSVSTHALGQEVGGRGGPEKETWTDLDLGSGQKERIATPCRDSWFLALLDMAASRTMATKAANPAMAETQRKFHKNAGRSQLNSAF